MLLTTLLLNQRMLKVCFGHPEKSHFLVFVNPYPQMARQYFQVGHGHVVANHPDGCPSALGSYLEGIVRCLSVLAEPNLISQAFVHDSRVISQMPTILSDFCCNCCTAVCSPNCIWHLCSWSQFLIHIVYRHMGSCTYFDCDTKKLFCGMSSVFMHICMNLPYISG